MSLAGRAALVTGAASGIGRAIAERFAAEGARVALLDRDEAVRDVAEAVGGLALVADVAVPEDVDRALDQAVAAFGPPDVVVNNAAIIRYGSFMELELEEFDDVMRVNAGGTFLVTQAAVRRMPEDGRPRAVVNLASAEGRTVIARSGHPQIHYGASKAAIEALTRALAVELAPRGIRVNAVCPGLVATPFTAGVAADPEASAWFLGHVLLDRFGRPEEIAAAALFLASDEASYVTGSTLVVDGGWLDLTARPCLIDQRGEQLALRRVARLHRLGVPLDGEHPQVPIEQLERLDDAVGRAGGDGQAVADRGDALVVDRVDVDLVRPVDRGQPRARLQQHGMGRAGGRHVLEVVIGEPGGRQVLHERPAERDVEHLRAAADPQQRGAVLERGEDDLALGGVAVGLDVVREAGLRRAVGRGLDVAAAREHDPVEPGEQVGREAARERRHVHGDAARRVDRLVVDARGVADLERLARDRDRGRARGDADQRPVAHDALPSSSIASRAVRLLARAEQEAVQHLGVLAHLDRDPRGLEGARVRERLLAQRVDAGHDQVRRRQPAEIGGAPGRRVGARGPVALPEPERLRAGEQRAVAGVRVRRRRRDEHRVEQHLRGERQAARVARVQRDGGREVAARAVARHDDPAVAEAGGREPRRRRHAVLERRGERMLRRAAVVDRDDRRPRRACQPAAERVVRVEVAEDPAPAVEERHRGTGGAAVDADRQRAGRPWDRPVVRVDAGDGLAERRQEREEVATAVRDRERCAPGVDRKGQRPIDLNGLTIDPSVPEERTQA